MPNSLLCHDSIYFIGRAETYNPSTEVYRNMLRLIAYDVTDPRRLRKVANLCKDYGVRIEYSVFECDLDEPLFNHLWEKLLKVIDSDKDRLVAYRICADCVGGINSVGVVCRPGKILLYII